MRVTLPAGTAGQDTTVEVLRKGVPSAPVTLEYVAGITGASASTLPTSGGKVRLIGTGLIGAWVLHPIAAGASTDDDVSVTPTVTDPRGRSVTFVLPAAPEGAYRLVLTPDQNAFPGAVAVFTGASVISFSDFG